jgi:hypothetical protein
MILKLDHSFKVVKRVRDASGHKQFGAVLTVMNEFCQVKPTLLKATSVTTCVDTGMDLLHCLGIFRALTHNQVQQSIQSALRLPVVL